MTFPSPLRTIIAILTTFTFTLNACTEMVAPPAAAIPFSPPPTFALWWRVVEQCSGITRPFDSVKWAIVPGVSSFTDGVSGDSLAGAFYSNVGEIVMAARDTSHGDEVRHEMLHALVGRPGHLRVFFYDKCGGYVSCVGACATQAAVDSAPSSSAVVVDRRTLEYGLTVFPETVSVSRDRGPYVIAATVRNPLPYTVRVPLVPLDADSTVSLTLGVINPRLEQGWYTWDYALSMDLRPGETRRYVYDGEAKLQALSLGAHTVRGFFNVDTFPPATLLVTP